MDKIKNNLKKFDLKTEQKANIYNHLEKIDKTLEDMISNQEKSLELYKENNININKIANNSGVSRQTLYNNPILIEYIENFNSFYSPEDPYQVIEDLRKEIRKKDKMIDNMVNRDGENSKLKVTIKQLNEELESAKITINSQSDIIKKLNIELNE